MTDSHTEGGDIVSDFGKHLKTLRQRRNFSMSELSRAAEVPRETISRLEAGKRYPTWLVLLRLAKALSVKLDEFVGDREAASVA